MTTYKKQQDGNIMYTEYTVKAGETTFKQVAKNHLYGDENRAVEIKVMKDGKISAAQQLQTGMVVLLPTTKYKVKAGETTVRQIARIYLQDESRFKEILQVKNGILAYPDENNLHAGEELLLPPVFAATGEFVTIKLTALTGSFIRSGHSMDSSQISAAPINTFFNYKKSSITKDSNGRIWVEVNLFPPFDKDKNSVIHPTGWLCVKEGQAYFTDPKID